MKEKPFLENLLVWRGLPNLLVIIGMVITLIGFLVGLSYKEMQIEKEHQLIISQTEDIQKQLNDYISNHK